MQRIKWQIQAEKLYHCFKGFDRNHYSMIKLLSMNRDPNLSLAEIYGQNPDQTGTIEFFDKVEVGLNRLKWSGNESEVGLNWLKEL